MAGRIAQAQLVDLALHTLGWKAFQDLCAQVCEEILKRPVEIFREAGDGGQDATFTFRSPATGPHKPATIQCKFSSKAERHLKVSDLTAEKESIAELVKDGQADTYVYMTNISVDAPIAVTIKKELRNLGVINPHLFGKQFITKAIRSSNKLRALVPRVYGLGDLSTILDERAATQTKSLLEHMLPTLKVYVPTSPHQKAVKILAKHGIVLLLGSPATGKSSIAAILSVMSAENPAHKCYKIENPNHLFENWNPNESGGFYWIDDAFGPNQLRDDFVDCWIANMAKLQAAIPGGNNFILTSRQHIYEAAKPKLGSRNHPLFRDASAVVYVGELTLNERTQILYNHIKAGNQPQNWKARVKPQLDSLAKEQMLLPEIARRLGDSAFTRHISTANDSLIKFIKEPKEHLLQTIKELSKLHRAALTLVFLHKNRLPVNGASTEMQQLVLSYFDIDRESLGQSILELKDSFISQTRESQETFWIFKHPTITDALSAVLAETEGMQELYLRGTKSETILSEAICSGATPISDAVVIPSALNSLLIERIAEVPDEAAINRLLFSFLGDRASPEVFSTIVKQYPSMLHRKTMTSWRLSYDPRIRAIARAHQMGLLDDQLRYETSTYLQNALFDQIDVSFLDDDLLLALIPPTILLNLSLKIRTRLVDRISSVADITAAEPDLDIEPEDNFDDLNSAINQLESLFSEDDSIRDTLADAKFAVDNAVRDTRQKKDQRDAEREEEGDWDWKDYARRTQRIEPVPSIEKVPSVRNRSPFSDVDE